MDLFEHVLRTVSYALVGPYLTFMLIIIGVIFYLKNKKITIIQKMIMGESTCSALELTLSQIVLGIFAGVIASTILTFLGVSFYQDSGIEIVFIISLLLMIYKPRWFCFSYSASILGIISVLLTIVYSKAGIETPIKVNTVYLMTFVGVLHFVEGLLVIVDGSRGSIPVFTNKDNKILGGFSLKRYWALPVAIFIILKATGATSSNVVTTPQWWPILKLDDMMSVIENAILILTPFYGVLGYSAVTFTQTKKEKVMQSGIFISAYGITLSLVAQLARIGIAGEIIVLIFAPVAHELMLYLQRRLEEKRRPIFVSDEEGICILEVMSNSRASEVGIKCGDKIMEINGQKVENEVEVFNLIKESYLGINLKIKTLKGKIKQFIIKPNKEKKFGIILVPKVVKKEEIININQKAFKKILEEIKKEQDDKDE